MDAVLGVLWAVTPLHTPGSWAPPRRCLSPWCAGVMVGLLAVARAVTALGRESFIPPIFSLVSVKLGTPIFTTAILGIVTGGSLSWLLS